MTLVYLLQVEAKPRVAPFTTKVVLINSSSTTCYSSIVVPLALKLQLLCHRPMRRAL